MQFTSMGGQVGRHLLLKSSGGQLEVQGSEIRTFLLLYDDISTGLYTRPLPSQGTLQKLPCAGSAYHDYTRSSSKPVSRVRLTLRCRNIRIMALGTLAIDPDTARHSVPAWIPSKTNQRSDV